MREFFVPRITGDREQARMRRWLTVVLVLQFAAWIAVLLIARPGSDTRISAGVNLALTGAFYLALRLGYMDVIRVAIPVAWYATFTQIAAGGDNVHDVVMPAFALLSVFPMFVISRPAAVAFTLLSCATAFWLSLAFQHDLVHRDNFAQQILDAVFLSVIYLVVLGVTWVSQSFAAEDLIRATESEERLREAKETVEARNAELGEQQKALAASEERYRLLADNAHDVVWVVDLNFKQVYCSPSVMHQRGYTPEELAEMSLEEQLSPEFIEPLVQAFREEMALESEGDTRRERMRSFEYKANHKNGSQIWLETVISGLRDENGALTHFLGVARDITERKKAEEDRELLELQIQQMQKMESLGMLAGGIAHDFNNILLGIMGNADLALMKLPRNADGREHIEHLIASAGRAADLCKQLLAYSGKGRFVIRAIDLSELVRDMSSLLEVSVSKNVTMRYQLKADLPTVEADATQLRQIVMNLMLNAVDAVGDASGTVTLRTGATTFGRDDIAKLYLAEDLGPGRYVFLEVSDTGAGMDAETQKRIFDPFFTTKPRGHGLGLAAVLGIVRGHGGGVKVYSEPGDGTCIRIYFPASELPADASAPVLNSTSDMRGSGTVLIVDDEQTIRELAQEALKMRGFSVLTAENGQEAVAIYKEQHHKIELVLLDMTMPVMNGEDTFRELRAIRPDVRAILSSGFNEQDAVTRFTGRGLAGFLQKPYLITDLFHAVEAALDPKT